MSSNIIETETHYPICLTMSFDLRFDNLMSLYRIVGADHIHVFDFHQIAHYPASKLHVFSSSSIRVLLMTIFILLNRPPSPPMWANVFEQCMRWSALHSFPNTSILSWFHIIFRTISVHLWFGYIKHLVHVLAMCCCIV